MFRLHELVDRLGGEIAGDGDVAVSRVGTLDKAGEGDLAFLANRKYLSQVGECAASALIVTPDLREALAGRNLILTADPYLYFARVAQLFNPPPRRVPVSMRSPRSPAPCRPACRWDPAPRSRKTWCSARTW